MYKSVFLFIFVILFTALGSAILIVDLVENKALHAMNGWVGGGLLILAAGFALPVQIEHLVTVFGPYLPGGVEPKARTLQEGE